MSALRASYRVAAMQARPIARSRSRPRLRPGVRPPVRLGRGLRVQGAPCIARASRAALPAAMRWAASSARACRASRRADRSPGSCCGASAAVFAAAGSQVRASGSGFGSRRYSSRCTCAMTAAASASAVCRGGQGWPAAIVPRVLALDGRRTVLPASSQSAPSRTTTSQHPSRLNACAISMPTAPPPSTSSRPRPLSRRSPTGYPTVALPQVPRLADSRSAHNVFSAKRSMVAVTGIVPRRSSRTAIPTTIPASGGERMMVWPRD